MIQSYSTTLFTFIHTPQFDDDCANIGLSDADLRKAEEALCERPNAGDLVKGTGGVRKLRVALGRKGQGKSGGARVLYYPETQGGFIWLLVAYDKSESETISDEGKKSLRQIIKAIQQPG
jgi:hypothetical protein